jgi:uncharacterized protein YjbJ (UPF0337 family)
LGLCTQRRIGTGADYRAHFGSLANDLSNDLEAVRKNFMNWDQVAGNWKQLKGKIREQWGELTDDELETVRGRRDQFEGLLQQKFGLAKEEAKRQIDEFELRCHL